MIRLKSRIETKQRMHKKTKLLNIFQTELVQKYRVQELEGKKKGPQQMYE